MVVIGWFAVGLSLLGNVFVIRKHWSGFAIWIVANLIWIGVDIHAGLFSQAALFGAYAVLAIWGLIKWKRG